MPEQTHKVIITGTGRAGTTLLVQLLTELGLDTGYRPGNKSRDYYEHCDAGLEGDLCADTTPYIVKNPSFCETLPAILAHRELVVDHALVAVRDLDDAAKSRIRVGGENGSVPGGLWGTSDPQAQKGVLAVHFHRLMHTLTVHEIPHTLLHFPRFAQDGGYAFSKLGFLAPAVSEASFNAAFHRVAKPELIHQFDSNPPRDAGAPAARFTQSRRRGRRIRRLTRVTIALIVFAAALLAARMIAERTAPPPNAQS